MQFNREQAFHMATKRPDKLLFGRVLWHGLSWYAEGVWPSKL